MCHLLMYYRWSDTVEADNGAQLSLNEIAWYHSTSSKQQCARLHELSKAHGIAIAIRTKTWSLAKYSNSVVVIKNLKPKQD